MAAFRIEGPPGVAPPVWLAHIVRQGIALALEQPADPLPLRVEGADNSAPAGNVYATRNAPPKGGSGKGQAHAQGSNGAPPL